MNIFVVSLRKANLNLTVYFAVVFPQIFIVRKVNMKMVLNIIGYVRNVLKNYLLRRKKLLYLGEK